MSKESETISKETNLEILPTFDLRFVLQRQRNASKRMAETAAAHSRRRIIRSRRILWK